MLETRMKVKLLMHLLVQTTLLGCLVLIKSIVRTQHHAVYKASLQLAVIPYGKCQIVFETPEIKVESLHLSHMFYF